jgi:hypothetical protein
MSGIYYRIIDTCNRQLQNTTGLIFFSKSVPKYIYYGEALKD